MLRNAGFSLLELLTVLILLGVIAGVSAPAIGRMLEGLDFRQQVGSVMANLRRIRLDAVVAGRPIEVRVEDNRFLLIRGNKEEEPMDPQLDMDSELSLDTETIIFSAESTVTPANLTLIQGNRSRIISMDPLSALPVIQ
ncbi:MAG: prepilin-type N-terminal cleavage/methylation domain-containing protein [Desulfobulbaceae bacterium]|uniref:Prepilin-type N-terminal cleavage/methylation domain-containing protein n=1 Tax=Candidatus Desulfobia pelagia TaxID=2841692 RepID=A0A8J6NEK4_9BACT|nr:prepilin-type N-terminal cleavage/methylation domain-containing protein [Candidatus Desulfobia pelagia]